VKREMGKGLPHRKWGACFEQTKQQLGGVGGLLKSEKTVCWEIGPKYLMERLGECKKKQGFK